MKDFLPLPPDWSAHGYAIDNLIGWVHWLMLFLFVGWGLYFLYVLFRFRAGAHPKASFEGAKGTVSKYIEIGVVIAEVALLVGLSIPVWGRYVADLPSEDEAVRVRVVAEQFAWNFHYPGADGIFGRTAAEFVDASANPVGLDRSDPAAADDITTINNLYLPIEKPVILYLTTKDVIHSFSLPYMRVKHDVIPGMTIPVWFTATHAGESEVGCAQLCGLGHYNMRGRLHTQTAQEYADWLASQAP